MTFSIVARDLEKGEFGIAVQSKFLAVGAVVPWARAGIGAIATQAWANTSYGPRGLELLASGLSAPEVIEILTQADGGREDRQVGIVATSGSPGRARARRLRRIQRPLHRSARRRPFQAHRGATARPATT